MRYSQRPEGASDLYITHRFRAKARWAVAYRAHPDHEHPATAAAAARLGYYCGLTPQRDDRGAQAVAWYRESGTRPGYLNRSERAHLARVSNVRPMAPSANITTATRCVKGAE